MLVLELAAVVEARALDSYNDLTPNATNVPMNAKSESQTKMPAKYLIINIDKREMPNANKAMYMKYFQATLRSLT